MDDRPFTWQEHADGVSFRVKVQPRSSRTGITGLEADCLKISLNAPPVEGEANAACLKFVAELFGVPKTRVLLVAGQKNRVKMIKISGITGADVEDKLGAILAKLKN